MSARTIKASCGWMERIVGDQLAGEGGGEDGLAQALGALEIGLHLGLGFAQDGEAAVDFGDDAVLFGERRNRNRKSAQFCKID